MLPLYPYQEPAVDLFLDRGSLLVAYEMGLGKTPIAIACAEELLGCGDIRTCLLVVPASLRYQWGIALAKFTDLSTVTKRVKDEYISIPRQEDCVIVMGTAAKRKEQLHYAQAVSPDYVIMSYETVQSDMRLVKRLKADMVCLDEASAIKNFGADRTKKIKQSLTPEYRLALTGTPVENRPEEAFSIMEWVDSDVLGDFDLYERSYIERDRNGHVKRYKNTKLLNHKLSAAMSRRSRKDKDVAAYLPEVDHDQWYVDLDERTRTNYDAMADHLLTALLAIKGQGSFDMAAYYSGAKQFDETTGIGKVMARQQAIEMMLDHTTLIEDSQTEYCQEVWPLVQTGTDPKLSYLLAKLQDILAYPENKVLVFSRYPAMQIAMSYGMYNWDVGSVRYHGGMSAAQKAASVAQFTNDRNTRVFLSSHAGAYGTDMHMANYLINYDLPWSGGTWDQINGRHQRVSSEFGKVYIRDLICADTIEIRKLAVLKHKLKVAQAVVDGMSPASGRIENDLVSLTEFLQGG